MYACPALPTMFNLHTCPFNGMQRDCVGTKASLLQQMDDYSIISNANLNEIEKKRFSLGCTNLKAGFQC